MSEQILEHAGPGSGPIKVDKARGILYGVKILGTQSKNGRRYPVGTLKKAIPLYENAKVNIDHPDAKSIQPRSYTDRLGSICNVHLRGEEGLYADFHFNPRHPLVEQLLWDAEHSPSNVGFSHNIDAVTRQEGGETLVEEILAVKSVDLVADPATTKGLFESVDIVGESTGITVTSPLEDFEIIRIENENLRRKITFLELLLERIASEIDEKECRYTSFFRAAFLEAVYRCTSEEEVCRLIADRFELVRQIQEDRPQSAGGSNPDTCQPLPATLTNRQSFLEAITGK